MITASAGLALAWNDIATKLFGNAFDAEALGVAGLWLVAIVCSAVVATVSEMSALQRVRATKVVPTVFVLETFIPILVGPLLLKTHLPLAPLSQVAFFGGLALVLGSDHRDRPQRPGHLGDPPERRGGPRARSAGGPGLGFLQLIESEDLQLARHRPREQVHRLCDPVVL